MLLVVPVPAGPRPAAASAGATFAPPSDRAAPRPLPPTVPAGDPRPPADPASPGPSGVARFGWPLAGTPRPVRRFDPPPQPWLPGHRGVDLAAAPGVDLAAAPGVEVRAAGAGIVLFAGPVAGRPVVTVGHADGLRTTYEPVDPRLPAGTPVGAGTPISSLRARHPDCPAAACLHWGLRRGEEYLDPLALLGLGPVRLLPLDGRP
ncbi:murein hydrolase activator EnvC [Micromonospora sp. MP36]|uniref:murein hydrolase activator EnvC family protein n=1 Tax=Micromonospora sp. MP36 TaxID=2604468 RepID=UPI00351B2E92